MCGCGCVGVCARNFLCMCLLLLGVGFPVVYGSATSVFRSGASVYGSATSVFRRATSVFRSAASVYGSAIAPYSQATSAHMLGFFGFHAGLF